MSFPLGHIETNTDGGGSKAFDVKKFLFRLWDFAPWIIISLLLSYGVALVVLRYSKTIYLISSDVLIKDNEEDSRDYNILREMGVLQNSKEVQNQIDILQSVTMMKNVIDSLNLDVRIVAKGKIAQSDLYGSKSPLKATIRRLNDSVIKPSTYQLYFHSTSFELKGEEAKLSYSYDIPFIVNGFEIIFSRVNGMKFSTEDQYFLQFIDKEQLAKSLHGTVHVDQVHEMGGIIRVNYVDDIPERGIDIVNMLINTYNEAGLQDKNIVTVKTAGFLNERIDTLARELDLLEMQAEDYRKSKKITDVGELSNVYFNQSLLYDKEIVVAAGDMEVVKGIESYLLSPNANTNIIPATSGIAEPTLIKMVEHYNQLVLDYQQQAGISTPSDPVFQRKKKQLDDLRTNLLQNISNIKSGYLTRIRKLEKTKGGFDDMMASLPEAERLYTRLKRQIGVKEQIYLYLLQKKEETDLSLASNINNTRVVDAAMNMGAVEPNKSRLIGVAIALGLTIPILILLITDFFNNKITERREVEEGTSTPIIGEVSFLERLQHRIISFNNKSLEAEQYRLIRISLRFFIKQQNSNVILVTSFMSGEGKSFTSINLAASFAVAGKNVIIVELDLRKPRLSEYIGVSANKGFTDYIVNNEPIENIIYKDSNHGFDFITSGPIPPNPSEMLMNDKMKDFFLDLRKRYEYIIIDTAPAGIVADTFVLTDYVDMSLFILRYQYSFKSTIEYLEKIRQEKRLFPLGIIINGIKRNKKLYYGYGYGYGYNDLLAKPYGNEYIDLTDDSKKNQRPKRFTSRKK
jgi:capsular exopolysaccharide synthesis family protein